MSEQENAGAPRFKIIGREDVTVCEWLCGSCEQHFVTNAVATKVPMGSDPSCPYCGHPEVEIV